MDPLLESTLNAAALRPDTKAQELLAAMVEFHQRNPELVLPTPLLVMLVAARSVC